MLERQEDEQVMPQIDEPIQVIPKIDERITWIDSTYWDQCFGTITGVRDQIVTVLWGKKSIEFPLSQMRRHKHGDLIAVGIGASIIEARLFL
jgi:hypothetical protein